MNSDVGHGAERPRVVQVAGVSKTYALGDSEVTALDNVSFSIFEPCVVAMMGPSGSGKSTLLNVIGALDKPTHGKVTVHGENLGRLDREAQARFRNRTIGFIFQNFNLIPVLTTLENVVLPSQLARHGRARQDRARELLVKVGLEKQMHQKVNRLSGGQQQRVSIARALINNPPLILADEPTANLDHDTADTILRILRQLCQEEKVTVLIATHDHEVLRFCDRIIRLHDGKLFGDEITHIKGPVA